VTFLSTGNLNSIRLQKRATFKHGAFNDFSSIESSYIDAKKIEKAFLQRMRLISPEIRKMRQNSRTCRVLAEELDNLTGP